MSVKIKGTYSGNLNVEILHEQSGTIITTAAPLDNNGDGSSFSPTDLVASALGSCMLTIFAIVAEKKNIDIKGSKFSVEKIMQSNPRRIAKLVLEIELPKSINEEDRKSFEVAARKCPVEKSLLLEVELDVKFSYSL